MVEFLQIVVIAPMTALMVAPITVPMLAVAMVLVWADRKTECIDAIENRRWKRWCVTFGIPSVLIAIGGAIAARYRGLVEDQLAAWLLLMLLCQLSLTGVGCWRCRAKWRSTLGVALLWGAYSLGASVASIYSSITHL